jgi:hypothetical protein
MIDDIIEFVDNEDEEGVIIFVDQQKPLLIVKSFSKSSLSSHVNFLSI